MSEVFWFLGQFPFWAVIAGMLILLAVTMIVGRWLRRREDAEQLHSEVDDWRRNLWQAE